MVEDSFFFTVESALIKNVILRIFYITMYNVGMVACCDDHPIQPNWFCGLQLCFQMLAVEHSEHSSSWRARAKTRINKGLCSLGITSWLWFVFCAYMFTIMALQVANMSDV